MSRDPIRNELRGLDAWLTREPPMDSEPDDDRIIGECDCCGNHGPVFKCEWGIQFYACDPCFERRWKGRTP